MLYQFRVKLWKYEGNAGWYFVTLPKRLSIRIRKNHGLSEEGWGRLKVAAKIRNTKWNSSIWYDTKAGGYLLPIKVSVRKAEQLKLAAQITVVLEIEDEDSRMIRWLQRS